MSDPRRLIDGDLGALARAALTSAEEDAPTRRARTRTLVALGVGATTLTSATVAAGTAAAAPPAVTSVVGAIATLKWVGVGVAVAGAVSAGITGYDAIHAPPATPVVVAPASAIAPTADVPAPPAPVATPAPVPSAAPAPSASVAPVVPSLRKSAPVVDTTVVDLATLDRVKAALDTGDARRARAILEANDAVMRGPFAPEAKVLRVEALALAGDDARAKDEARAFLDAYPTSPAAKRVRTVLSSLENRP
jgi:hypothetical protein